MEGVGCVLAFLAFCWAGSCVGALCGVQCAKMAWGRAAKSLVFVYVQDVEIE
jgi:hypothetical protein